MKLRILVAGATLSLLSGMAIAESGFLSDYSQLKPVKSSTGEELVYVAPGAYERAVGYTSVMVDQPEILFSARLGVSRHEARGYSRTRVDHAQRRQGKAGGTRTVQGRRTTRARCAVCAYGSHRAVPEEEEAGALGYTPIGAVVKVGSDRLKETLEKIDIIEMTFEAELVDSMSKDVLAAIVVPSGARKAKGQKEQRMDMTAFRAPHPRVCVAPELPAGQRQAAGVRAHRLHRSEGTRGP